MLKIAGQWVSPAEIEECAMSIADVADAAVIGTSDADGLTRPALFIVARELNGDRDELLVRVRDTIARQVAPHKRPRDISFVDHLPRTATGKLRRFLLRQPEPDQACRDGER
jgi:benzoate-CoA ligase